MVRENVQLLVEYDFVTGFGAGRSGEPPLHAFAVGINAMITPAIELITELRRDQATDGNPANHGLAVGFIATLPSPH